MRIRTLLCLLGILFSGLSQAEIYTWKDAQGRTHFGDRPPPESAPEQLDLEINTIHRSEIQPLDGDTPSEQKVVIYTADWCGVCRQAKTYFKRNRIPYQEYDVEKSAKGRRDYKRLNGSGVPIILVGKQRMNGFSPDNFDQLYRRP
jgi:glutaredoxin